MAEKKVVTRISFSEYCNTVSRNKRLGPYIQAYLEPQFRGILKTEQEWSTATAPYIKG